MSFIEDFFNNPLGTTKKTVDDVWDWSLDLVGDVISWFIEIPELPDFGDQQQGFLVNKQANDQPIPIVYGERLIGGTRVFVETAGTDNKNLYICLALCEGPVDAIGDIYIDDVLSTDSKYSGLVTIDKKLGASPQTGSSTLEEAPSWTTSHRLNGVAYLGIKIVFDADVFRGIPTITAKVRGRKIYDPRKDSTSTVYNSELGTSSHRSDNSSTWEWSDNPALCLRDYLADDLYGKGIPYSEIDEQGIADGADFCDSTITEYTGGDDDIKIYRCNAILDTGQSIFNNTTALLKGMRGMLPFSNGKYKLVIDDDPASSVFSFNADNIISDINVASNSRKQRYNRCVAKFTNRDANFQPDEAAYPEKDSTEYTTFKAEDNGIEQELQLDLPTITSVYQARDIARVAVLSSRQQSLSVSFTADSSAIRVEVGDLVLLTYTALGFTNKQFKCRGMSINPDSTCSFQLLEHDATAYPWEVLSEVDALSSPNFIDPADVALPLLSAGSLLIQTDADNDGADRRYIKYSFPASSYEYVDYYEVQLSEGNTGSYRTVARTTNTEYRLYSYVTGTTLAFRYRIVSQFNTKSEWNDSIITPTSRDEVYGLRITDESAPVGKLQPRTNFDFLGTPSNPEYKFFLGPSGSGSGFENSDYALGGKSYQANEGGIVAYAEQGPAFAGFAENINATTQFPAVQAFGGWDQSEGDSASYAKIGSYREAGRFIIGDTFTATFTNVTNTSTPVVTTASAHNFKTGDSVVLSSFTGTWSTLNGLTYYITVLTSTTFRFESVDLSLFPTYSSNGGIGTNNRPDFIDNGVGADVAIASFEGTQPYSVYTYTGTTGPFTASHDGLIEKAINPELGDILIDVEVKAAPSINDAITSVAISSQANQAGVIGVFAGTMFDKFAPAALSEIEPYVVERGIKKGGNRVVKEQYQSLFDQYKTIKINSIGEGKINVCGQAGNISVGDLIVASDTQGKGMKQSDDIIRSYTVAKSRENVTFASADEVKQIACIYLGG